MATAYINKYIIRTDELGQITFTDPVPLNAGSSGGTVVSYQVPFDNVDYGGTCTWGLANGQTTVQTLNYVGTTEVDEVTYHVWERAIDNTITVVSANNSSVDLNVTAAFTNVTTSQIITVAQQAISVTAGNIDSLPSLPPDEVADLQNQINDKRDRDSSALTEAQPTATDLFTFYDGSSEKTVKYTDFVNFDTYTIVDSSNGKSVTLTYDSSNAGGNVASINYPSEFGNVSNQLGQENWLHGYNNTVSTINNGYVVAITGSANDTPTIELASNDDDTVAHNTIGVATQDIITMEYGKVTTFGLVRGLNIGTGFSEGDIVYLATNGFVTNVRPPAPTPVVEVGVAIDVSLGAIQTLFVTVDKMHKLDSISDVEFDTLEDGDTLRYDGTKFVNYDLDNLLFQKTGWTKDITGIITLDLNETTKIFTLSTSQDTPYWIQNTEYTLLASTPKTIDLTSIITTNGSTAYYITLQPNGQLSVSTSVWNIRDNSQCLVAELYWNDTQGICVNCAYEMHTFEMDALTHFNTHFTDGTTIVSGLGVSQTAAAETIDVTQGSLMDEDILVSIVDGLIGTAPFTQTLAPLISYKYYRLGANEIYREALDTNTALVVGGVAQVNPFDGSVYTLEGMTNNQFGAMWVVFTTDTLAPVQLWVGQEESATLTTAKELNSAASMNFGSIPIQEIRVAYRIMIKRVGTSYEIEEIEKIVDVENFSEVSPATDHNALSNLTVGDPHTQYLPRTESGDLANLTTTDKTSLVNAINEAATTGGSVSIPDGSILDVKLSDTAGQIKDRVSDNTTNIASKAPLASPNFTGTNTGIVQIQEGNNNTELKIWSGTQAEYDLLTPDANTIYYIEV